MTKRWPAILGAIFCLIPTLLGQQTPPSGSRPTASDKEYVVRIVVNLVQVDAVVTDKNGRPVTDLKAEDFEIFQDGRRQEITHFSYISNESDVQSSAPV